MKIGANCWFLGAVLVVLTSCLIAAPVERSTNSHPQDKEKSLQKSKDTAIEGELQSLKNTENVNQVPVPNVAVESSSGTEVAAQPGDNNKNKEEKLSDLAPPLVKQAPFEDDTEDFAGQNENVVPEEQQMSNFLDYPSDNSLSGLDLSPKAVAEYLLVTGNWEVFDESLLDLIKTGVLTPEETGSFRDEVSLEYENLLRSLISAEDEYLQEVVRPMEDSEPYYRSARRIPPNMGLDYQNEPEPMLDISNLGLDVPVDESELEAEIETQITLEKLLQAIVDEYRGNLQDEDKNYEMSQKNVLDEDEMEDIPANAVAESDQNNPDLAADELNALAQLQNTRLEEGGSGDVDEVPENESHNKEDAQQKSKKA